MSENGLITITSNHSVKETLDRLEASLRGNGVTVFARIDHAAAAASVDMTLPPTELIIFGQPKAGTPLMQALQTTGIDLPLKALVWEDPGGKVWLYRRVSIGAFISRRGKPHVVDELVDLRDHKGQRRVYARGRVRHVDHKTVRFPFWVRVVRNREVAEQASPFGGGWID